MHIDYGSTIVTMMVSEAKAPSWLLPPCARLRAECKHGICRVGTGGHAQVGILGIVGTGGHKCGLTVPSVPGTVVGLLRPQDGQLASQSPPLG